MTQEQAFQIYLQGKNIFLTGQAGTGKSYLLGKIIEDAERRNIRVSRTASTGIAGTHIGGTTIHSWSGIGIKTKLTTEDLFKVKNNRFSSAKIVKTDLLIIDEISMLSANTLDNVDEVCRFVRGKSQPFGGIQVIVCGDFFQLPPVADRISQESADFAFNAPSWQGADFAVCYLEKNYRQAGDQVLIGILNRMRAGELTQNDISVLLSPRNTSQIDLYGTKLFSTNKKVDAHNLVAFYALQTPIFTYFMQCFGHQTLVDAMKKNCLSPENLALRVGTKVMFTVNNHQTGDYYNGTMGEVVEFHHTGENDDEPPIPVVKIYGTGKIVHVTSHKWERKELDENGKDKVSARIVQLPLRWAWAVTIHKSQGCSFDYVHMNLANIFEKNQGYVAVSRARTLDGLSVEGAHVGSFDMHEVIMQKDKQFRALSKSIEKHCKEA
jgi:ATP-dependent exoDNAse (exonuclease V) alpha subunit